MKKKLSILYLDAISRGCESLNAESFDLLKKKLLDFESSEGGFNNGGGNADIYYTSFGLILSYVLGVKLDIERHKKFVNSVSVNDDDLINQAALIKCRMLLPAFKIPFRLRKFVKFNIRPMQLHYDLPSVSDVKTMYDAFLCLNILQDLLKSIHPLIDILARLELLRNEDGGFPNNKGELSHVTATVSFVLFKFMLKNEIDQNAVEFLLSLQDSSGGFKSSKVVPIADMLSTATALTAFNICGCSTNVSSKEVSQFIAAHWINSGGFSATILDQTTDPEYIFYGLLAIGMNTKT
ncbi:MAG: terpene cyclase/mutase family protein [Kiritimatiellae bacterium]|jgi:prenyltransferase beta subunit|nr:terpene cyclase/mutase family protein [Kiritimatiellia bacterium]